MRLGISGIAWDVDEDAALAELLRRYGVDAVDIAPGKYFPDFAAASDDAIAALREHWRALGMQLTGMQSLLFGTTGLNLFGNADSRARMQRHLIALMRIAAGLGATRMVFGSPKNRDRSDIADADVLPAAVHFFTPLAEAAGTAGVLLCLEPNPARYGSNFMTDSESTAAVVRAIDHPSLRMQLDIGALAINGESAATVLARHRDLVGHVHASEPDLLPLGDGGADHAGAAAALRAQLPDALVMIEMVATAHEPHLQSIERALQVALTYYGAAA